MQTLRAFPLLGAGTTQKTGELTLAALSKPLYKTNIVLDLLKKPRLNDVAFRYIKQPFFNDVLFSFGQFIFCSL